jgi:exosortase E/protease (VPEID-CTERM system)
MAVAEIPDVNPSAPSSRPPLSPRQSTSSFPPRIVAAAVVLALECIAYSRFPDHRLSQHLPITALIVFCITLCFFARPQLRAAHLDDTPIDPRFALLHGILIGAALSETLIFTHFFPPKIFSSLATPTLAVSVLWAATVIALILSLTAALFPLRRLAAALSRSSWLFAALITAALIPARVLGRSAWDATHSRIGLAFQTATFDGVKRLLDLFYPTVISTPTLKLIGTPTFKVIIAGSCSGVEGLALMLFFTIGWLIYTRRELRLKRALLLVPLALGISWLLNLARITALIAIGNAGHPRVALSGFHSEAGWILFNATALLFLLAAEHIPWLRRTQPCPDQPPPQQLSGHTLPAVASPNLYDRNLAAPYLVPFLAVLATSLLTRAASSGFEALYPLRFAVALLTLFYYRADYRRLNWRLGWLGPLAGLVIFAFWIPLAHFNGIGADSSPLATQLSRLSALQRIAWITIRAAAAILTVPIIEELAFRGYLARRIQSSDIDSIPFANLSILAIALSSVAFGALHGSMWIAGILSGLIFALVAKFSNRLSEAIAAHATANLLIAIWVLSRHNYSLW